MPNTRIMLWLALAAILYLNYEAWMRDYQEPAAAAGVPNSQSAAPALGESVPQAAVTQAPTASSLTQSIPAPPATNQPPATTQPPAAAGG